jgi:exodeoxyribonuclease VII large subunit
VRDAAGRPLRTAAAVTAGMGLEIEFADGRVGARAQGSLDSVAPSADKPIGEPARPRTRRDGGPGQGDLF